MPKNQFECFYHLVIESVKVTTHSFLQKKFTLQNEMDEEVNGCHICTLRKFGLVGQLRVKENTKRITNLYKKDYNNTLIIIICMCEQLVSQEISVCDTICKFDIKLACDIVCKL